jgi:hypothetical protein
MDTGSTIKIVPYKDSDYVDVSRFYLENGWPEAPRKEILPTTGFVAIGTGGQKLAVGFLYESNSNVYFLEWTATNPKAALRRRALAFKLLVKTVMGIVKKAKPLGQIMQFTPNEAIIRTYKKLGFKETERATLLIWG